MVNFFWVFPTASLFITCFEMASRRFCSAIQTDKYLKTFPMLVLNVCKYINLKKVAKATKS